MTYGLSNSAISDDLEWPLGHSRVVNIFKCDLSYSSAAADKISTDEASRGPSAMAELLVASEQTNQHMSRGWSRILADSHTCTRHRHSDSRWLWLKDHRLQVYRCYTRQYLHANTTLYTHLTVTVTSLWPPYVIGQAIIFALWFIAFFFYLSFFLT